MRPKIPLPRAWNRRNKAEILDPGLQPLRLIETGDLDHDSTPIMGVENRWTPTASAEHVAQSPSVRGRHP